MQLPFLPCFVYCDKERLMVSGGFELEMSLPDVCHGKEGDK